MKLNNESIKKFFLIGLSLFLFKSVLIAFAYLLNEEQYNLFNQSYYTSSLLILFGSLGFNIAQTRIPVNSVKLMLFVSINTIIAFTLLHIISSPFQNAEEIIPVLLYCIFISVSGILNFKILFSGDYKKYFYILLSLTSVHLLSIPITKLFDLQMFPVLSASVVVWFIFTFRFFDKEFNTNFSSIEYFKIGFSAFVINSAVSLGLAGDKFIVNHFFTADIANAYTFAWSLTAPIFYIGTLIEKYLFAEQKPDRNKILKKGFLLSTILITTYSLSIILAVQLFPFLLPDSVSKDIFKSIFNFMITGYSTYVIFHFPLNTYLFKVIDTPRQKTISKYFLIVILIFIAVFYSIVNIPVAINYRTLLSIVWVYIFLLLIIKAVIIFRTKQSKNTYPTEIITEEIQEVP